MDYEDRVLIKLQEMIPGEKIRMEELREPHRFTEAVKYLVNLGVIHQGDYSFSPDYNVLVKHHRDLFHRQEGKEVKHA